MNRSELETDFCKYLWDFSPVKKDLYDLHESSVDVAVNIVEAFLQRNTSITLTGVYEVGNQYLFTYSAPDKDITLELYREWHFAWRSHGYDAPFFTQEGI